MSDKEVSFTIRAKDAASAAVNQVANSTKRAVEEMFGLKSILSAISSVAVGFSLVEVIRDIIDLGSASDKTFRQIAANLPTFTAGIDGLRESMEELAQTSGRSREEIESAAVEISRLGVADAGEVQQRLQAATDFADVTGSSVTEVVGSLNQLMDAFKISSGDARTALIQLNAAARDNQVSTAQILEALPRVTARAEELGLSFNDTVRAIIYFVNEGIPARKLMQEFNAYDAAGLKEFANYAKVSGGAAEQFNTRLTEVRDGIDRTNQKIKNEFSKTLADLGERTIPTAQRAMAGLIQTTLQMFDVITKGPGIMGGAGANPDPTQWTGWNVGGGTSATWGGPPKAPPPDPATIAQQKAQQELMKQAGELATKIAKDQIALDAVFAKSAKDARDAWDQLAEVFASISDDALVQFDAKTQKTLDGLKQRLGQIIDPAQRQAISNQIDSLTSHLATLRVAVEETRDTSKELDLEFRNFDGNSALSFINDWSDKAAEVHEKMLAATDPAVAAEYKKEWDLIAAAIERASADIEDYTGKTHDATEATQQIGQINQWTDYARQLIGAGEAMHAFGSSAAQAAQSVVSLGEGVAKLVATGGTDISAWIETVTSALSLGSQLFSGGPNGQQRLQMASQQLSIQQLLVGIQHQLTGDDSLAAQLEDLDLQFAEYRQQVEESLAGKANEAQRNAVLAEITADYAQAVQKTKDDFAAAQTATATAAKQNISSVAVQGITTIQADQMLTYTRASSAYLASIASDIRTLVTRGAIGVASASTTNPADPSVRALNQQLGAAAVAESTRGGSIVVRFG